MKFEWDEQKRLANIRKHRIDFKEILDIFEKEMVEIIDIRADYGEERIIGIGLSNLIKSHHTVVAVVYIEKLEDVIRIILARKALKHEQRIYYKEIF